MTHESTDVVVDFTGALNYTDAQRPHITAEGPGRCVDCSFYVAMQGHRACCSTLAAVTPGEAPFGARPALSFLEFIEACTRIKEAQRSCAAKG